MAEWPKIASSNPYDLIEDFMELTRSDYTPDLFRLWSGISLLAGALERRVWTVSSYRGGDEAQCFPNMYVLLVGPPGSGKGIISDIRTLWINTLEPGTKKQAFKVAPDSVTKAALIDCLVKATQSRLLSSGPPYEYNSLLVPAEEFGVFLNAYDLEFISVLNKIYDNRAEFTENRRYGVNREVKISNPQLNILAGAQPGWMATTFPEEAWTMGFSSRMVMVYASQRRKTKLFVKPSDDVKIIRARLVAQLGRLSQLYGEAKFTREAEERIEGWYDADCPPTPEHSRLETYNARRILQAIKLSIISSVSRTCRVTDIDLFDVERAINWLIAAEKVMPDIFRAMKGKSDHQVMEELHAFVLTWYTNNKKKPVAEAHIYRFLAQNVPSDKAKHILELAEKANYIARLAGTNTYIPQPKETFRPE